MKQQDDLIPQSTGAPRTPPRPPAERPVSDPAEQAPLGSNPTYEDVLDTAVDYTFPCSDPIAVDQSCARSGDAPRRQPPPGAKGPSI